MIQVKYTLEKTEWTITNGKSRDTNKQTLATLGTQDTDRLLKKYKHQRKPKWQSRMDNPEKHTTLGTQDIRQTVGSK